jgi:hypothetical protein
MEPRAASAGQNFDARQEAHRSDGRRTCRRFMCSSTNARIGIIGGIGIDEHAGVGSER